MCGEKCRQLLRIILQMKKYAFILITILTFILSSCNWHKDRLTIDVSDLKIQQVRIGRYDQDLFKIPVNDLKAGLMAIRPSYLFFLGTDLNDTMKLAEMKAYLTNPRTIDFHNACNVKFPDLSSYEIALTDAFRHYKYYFPGALIPRVYSYISGGDYENPVQFSDSVIIIALDTYLGSDFKPYLSDGLSIYKVQTMTPDYIVPDCIMALSNSVAPPSPLANTLLDQMIDAGKRLYITDALLPSAQGNLKIKYTREQFDWITKNESHVWSAMIENRMLYSSNGQLLRAFFADGPNSAAFGNESPPRLGEWIGWRIVKSFMDNNTEITLSQLIREKDAQKILTLSGYKPEKK
jgi:hypothetical protein